LSIMKRMRDITVATLNDKLEHAEDPVRLIDAWLHDRREQIMQSEKLFQQITTHASSVRQQYVSAEQMKEKREQQAMLALKAGEEHVARMALQEKLLQEEKSEQYRDLYEQAQRSVIELEDQLAELKSDYQEVYNKRQYYAARLESVRLQQRMNEHMRQGGFNAGDRLFNRLEEKVSDLEHEAKALRDIRRQGFDALDYSGAVMQQTLEKELEVLRNKLEQKGWVR